jgi:E3 ubiquitin-protein ligase BAH
VSLSLAACDAQFFPELDKAVAQVVQCFNTCAEDLLRQHSASGLMKFLMKLRRKMAGDTANMIQVGNMLVSYGCMNSLAVRKILKKYDKVLQPYHASHVN